MLNEKSWCVELVASIRSAASFEQFAGQAMSSIRDHFDCAAASLFRAEKGRWVSIASSGNMKGDAAELLGEALDQSAVIRAGELVARTVEPFNTDPLVLLLASPRKWNAAELDEQVNQVAGVLTTTLSQAQDAQQQRQRIAGLEAILKVAARWNQTHDMKKLLTEMAEAATRLLGAERASIFLWDRANRSLVGRPALGVEGGELRIPDDAGVVGSVFQTGEARRVDEDIAAEQRQIDRRFDEKLEFTTRNLLCVPLRCRKGDMLGAFEMINKIGGNFSKDDQDALTEMATHAAIALENTQEFEQLVRSRDHMTDEAAAGISLVGESSAIEALRSTIHRVANTDLAVLILGENGTGKEVISQLTHYLSNRRGQPMVSVNCAALTETLLESELFGHEKGAFTDAHQARAGKFELASRGTLFLDEIGDMSLSGQAKLLRALEEKVIVRVGGSTPIHTDVRVFAATNQDLAKLVRERKFREDLFYRLNVVTLELPPLRERGEDVLILADHFLREFSTKARRKRLSMTEAARKRLLSHSWPGNVRELRNLIERLAFLTEGERIDVDDLAFVIPPTDQMPGMASLNLNLAEATKTFQTQYIKKQIEMTRGNMTDAARRLGLHRSNLYRKMQQLDMETSGEG